MSLYARLQLVGCAHKVFSNIARLLRHLLGGLARVQGADQVGILEADVTTQPTQGSA